MADEHKTYRLRLDRHQQTAPSSIFTPLSFACCELTALSWFRVS